ncbi:MAG: hypothetical protein IT381_15805 [Deltaproteobacteria bacterium]|nr:hypothetical protein [Deltaproteobacteria bacterium]
MLLFLGRARSRFASSKGLTASPFRRAAGVDSIRRKVVNEITTVGHLSVCWIRSDRCRVSHVFAWWIAITERMTTLKQLSVSQLMRKTADELHKAAEAQQAHEAPKAPTEAAKPALVDPQAPRVGKSGIVENRNTMVGNVAAAASRDVGPSARSGPVPISPEKPRAAAPRSASTRAPDTIQAFATENAIRR